MAVSTLAAGTLTTTTAAAGAADTPPQQEGQKLLGLDPIGLLLSITTGTIASIQTTIAGLSPTDLGDLLQAADVSQLDKLVPAAQNNGQLAGALDTLTPTENGDLLSTVTGSTLSTVLGALDATELTGILSTLTSGELDSVVDGLTATQTGDLLGLADTTQLTSLLGVLTSDQLSGALGTLDHTGLTAIVGGLAPSQIAGLLGAGGSGSVIDGLLGVATGLGGTPGTSQIDALLGQVTALLGGGVPALGDLTDLASLLGILNPLLAQAGVDSGLLSSLRTTVDGLLAATVPDPLAAPLRDLARTIDGVLSPVTGGGGSPGGGGSTIPGTTTPGATTRPGAPAIVRPGATTGTQAAARPGPFRATIGTIKVSKKRTSMKFMLSCPTSAPKGCLVQLSAKIAGQKAIRATTVALASGRSTPVTVTLSKSTTKRLKKKGGSLKVTAKTALSTLGSSTQSVKVKKPKAKRKR